MARKGTALLAATFLLIEAVGVVFVHLVLGRSVQSQSMSLAGIDTDVMATTTYVLGGTLGLFLTAAAALLVLAAARDRAPAGAARLVLIGCAITQTVLGALVVGPVGWGVFAFLMAAFSLLVLALTVYRVRPDGPPDQGRPADPGAAPDAGSDPQVGDGHPELAEQ
ncbi:hypothetical protein [Streptomyces sp. NPDC006879]|uniref:hypothetical protein n=1 Tax=Streptomyces sp. NPDC006879 TaxID=3364767 RepID=UPI00367B7D1D